MDDKDTMKRKVWLEYIIDSEPEDGAFAGKPLDKKHAEKSDVKQEFDAQEHSFS